METIPRDKILFEKPSDLPSCINRVQRLTDCIEIANLINSELSLGRLLNAVMETAKKAFHADSVSLLLLEEETRDLVFQIALGDVGDEIREIYRLKKGEGIAGMVAESGTPMNLPDVYDHPRFSPDYDKKTNYRTRAMICVPLKARGRTLGVIQVMNKQVAPFYFTQEEMEMLITISSSAAVAIDTARMHRIIIQKETLERDLALAKEVQQSFLPTSLPVSRTFDFFAVNRPALEIGGDFYNFFELPDQRIGVVIGDVSGKGIAAALFMARLTSDLQYHALLLEQPAELLGRINTLLCQRAKHGMFVTLIYLVLNPETGHIVFSNAGHLSPICSGGGTPAVVGQESAKGPPLGIIDGLSFAQEELLLTKGQALTLYTDGITEAKNNYGDLFGLDRLLSTLAEPSASARKMAADISTAVDRFILSQGRSDDITLVTLMAKKDQ